MKLRLSPAHAALLLVASGCGGSSTAPPIDTTTTTTTSSTVNQATTTTPPSSNTEDPNASKCGNLAPGPVVRYAITPREQRADNVVTDIRVRARPGFDEVWCIDKDKEHRLDFNSNQRNAQGRECCWVDDPSWDFEDPDRMVQSGAVIANTNGFNYRMRVNPRGARGEVHVEAIIDGVVSFPWQSGSGYKREALRIVSMSRNEIERDCLCTFRGNGIYEGDRCNK
jgi:hypothetical protein